MRYVAPWLQSRHASIRREAGRAGTLRDHDGCAPRPSRRHHGRDHRRHGAGRPTRRLLPESALARQTRHGYPNHHEELDRRERAHPERDGRAKEKSVKLRPLPLRTRRYTKETRTNQKLRDTSCPSWLMLLLYGFTVTITTPCDATGVVNLPVTFPKSLCCHKSRTEALSEMG